MLSGPYRHERPELIVGIATIQWCQARWRTIYWLMTTLKQLPCKPIFPMSAGVSRWRLARTDTAVKLPLSGHPAIPAGLLTHRSGLTNFPEIRFLTSCLD
jgi:hypothetical protein